MKIVWNEWKKGSYSKACLLLILIASELIMSFSSLGYINTQPVSQTFIHIPVLIGAMLLGPVSAMILGGIFGLTSIWKAGTTVYSYEDLIFSPFLSPNPFGSIVLSVVTRVLFGLIAALMFQAALKGTRKRKKTAVAIAASLATWLHSVFIYLSMQLFFPEAGLKTADSISKLLSVNVLIVWGVTVAAVLICYHLRQSGNVKTACQQIDELSNIKMGRKRRMVMYGFFVLLVAVALTLVYHFVSRTSLVFDYYQIQMPGEMYHIFLQLGLQFIAAIGALFTMLACVVAAFIKISYAAVKKAEEDSLTGLNNKLACVNKINEILCRQDGGGDGIFMILDIDRFKGINDTFGHPFGDEVIVETANVLLSNVRKYDVVGRLGGDEFCMFLPGQFSRPFVSALAQKICDDMNKIVLPVPTQGKISCSIGITWCSGSTPQFEQLYIEADTALYQAKKQGRNGFWFYEPSETVSFKESLTGNPM